MVSQRAGSSRELAGPLCPGSARPSAWLLAGTVVAVLLAGACGGRKSGGKIKLPAPVNPRPGWTETGVASWYGEPYHGRRTSNGEIYDMNKMTAAHKRLPFDTWVEVTNLTNGAEARVRINDRGPFVGNRIIDLSRAAAGRIGMISSGTARVRLRVVRPPGRDVREATGQRGQPRQPPSARSEGQFDVQIGVFAGRGNARALAERVRKWGHRTDVQEYRAGDAPRYRVIVIGGSRNQANSTIRQLKRRGINGILRARGGG